MGFGFQIDIEAPVDRVWQFLDDEDRLPQWMPEVVETTYLHGGSEFDPVGARFRQKIRKGHRVQDFEGAVIAHEPGRALVLRLRDQVVVVDLIYGLQALGTGTRLDFTAVVTPATRTGRLLSVFVRPFVPHTVRRNLVKLKELAELTPEAPALSGPGTAARPVGAPARNQVPDDSPADEPVPAMPVAHGTPAAA